MTRTTKYKDFTLKARVANHLLIQQRLLIMNATLVGTDYQKDTYFQADRGKLKLRQGNIENLITHYERVADNGIEQTTVFRYDLNPTGDQVEFLYKTYATLGVIEKERTIWWMGSVKIHLDTLADNTCYVELEAIDRDDAKSKEILRQECFHMKEILGIPDRDLIQTGYWIP